MTKAELIRKIAKKAGVPDTEAKLFFEIFLKEAADKLRAGQALFIKGFGYFQFRKGILKEKQDTIEGEQVEEILSDLMLFFDKNEFNINVSGALIFNIPSFKNEDTSFIDSFLSLSIGKPAIPLKDASGSEFFIPPTSSEMHKLLVSKVDKLINEAEFSSGESTENEYLLLNTDTQGPSQYVLQLGEDKNKESGYKYTEKSLTEDEENFVESSEFDSISWDFGEDLSRQIEEESLLDISKDEESLDVDSETGVSWNFGVKDSEKQEDEIETTDSDFQRVKSITATIESDDKSIGITKSEASLSWSFGVTKPEQDVNRSSGEVEEFENAMQKKDSDTTRSYYKTDEEISATSKSNRASTEKKAGKGDSVKSLGVKDYTQERRNMLGSSSRRSTSVVFFIALFVIIAVGVVLFLYLRNSNYFRLNKKNGNTIVSSKPAAVKELIERDYKIPVTYPYAKGMQKDVSFGEVLNPSLLESTNLLKTESADYKTQSLTGTNNQKESNNKRKRAAEVPPSKSKIPVVSLSSADNIYKYGDVYAVQVSSWKSRAIAEKQADKYSSKGYNAFVERAVIPGRGTWYRVRVGYFSSQTEAQKFLSKNK